jgi:alginate O-acetyltransferase complex protein AlgJ
MTPAPVPTPPRRVWIDRLLIAVFFLLLWVPTADMIFHVDPSRQAGENRLPAPPPNTADLRAGEVQKFLAASEAWFGDHFGFRNLLIRWFQNWKLGLFHDRTVYKVVIGPNHWLFIGEERMVEHYLGSAKFTPAELQAWQKLLERRRDWLAARGIKYLFVVPPDKQDIYPEELPAWLRNAVPAGRETKLDQFLKYMRANSTVEIVDLRATLLDGKKIRPTYLQNDTHWNLFGGFLAAQQVVGALQKQLPDLPPLRTEDFTWTNAPAAGGDLATMLGTPAAPEINHFKFTAAPSVALPVLHDATNLVSDWTPQKFCAVSDTAAPLANTALVFHDSFGMFWRPVLGCCFKRVGFASDNREFNARAVLENHPSVVVSEILERYFNTADPVQLLARDALK